MSAIRLPLLYAFAGGCLSNIFLFGVWRIAEGVSSSAVEQRHHSHHVVELVTAASTAPSVAQPTERVAISAADHGQDPATEAPLTPIVADPDNGGAAPAGSSVSDVLSRLETAYRERVVASAPVQAPTTQERATVATSPGGTLTTAEAAPSVPTQPAAEVVPATLAAAAPQSAAPAPQLAAPAPQSAAPQLAAPAPQLAALQAVAPPDAPPPTVVQYGDLNQNTYITNVREGDVYQIQMQQIAVLQYMQLLGMSGLAAPARRAGGAGHQRGALSSGITNPDNPWGFHFAPLNLVR